MQSRPEIAIIFDSLTYDFFFNSAACSLGIFLRSVSKSVRYPSTEPVYNCMLYCTHYTIYMLYSVHTILYICYTVHTILYMYMLYCTHYTYYIYAILYTQMVYTDHFSHYKKVNITYYWSSKNIKPIKLHNLQWKNVLITFYFTSGNPTFQSRGMIYSYIENKTVAFAANEKC